MYMCHWDMSYDTACGNLQLTRNYCRILRLQNHIHRWQEGCPHVQRVISRGRSLTVTAVGYNLATGLDRYNIDDLAEQGDFTDSCYALLHGELPTAAQREEFQTEVTRHTMVHEQLIQFYKGFRHDAHPMAIMVGVTGALSAFYANAADVR